MRTQPGHRDEVIEILLSSAESLESVGCYSYVVGASETDADVICVSEVWESKEAHDASLELPATREAIAQAMPLLMGEFTGYEMTIRGGLGVPTGDRA